MRIQEVKFRLLWGLLIVLEIGDAEQNPAPQIKKTSLESANSVNQVFTFNYPADVVRKAWQELIGGLPRSC